MSTYTVSLSSVVYADDIVGPDGNPEVLIIGSINSPTGGFGYTQFKTFYGVFSNGWNSGAGNNQAGLRQNIAAALASIPRCVNAGGSNSAFISGFGTPIPTVAPATFVPCTDAIKSGAPVLLGGVAVTDPTRAGVLFTVTV